jgi:hypothetical protein
LVNKKGTGSTGYAEKVGVVVRSRTQSLMQAHRIWCIALWTLPMFHYQHHPTQACHHLGMSYTTVAACEIDTHRNQPDTGSLNTQEHTIARFDIHHCLPLLTTLFTTVSQHVDIWSVN